MSSILCFIDHAPKVTLWCFCILAGGHRDQWWTSRGPPYEAGGGGGGLLCTAESWYHRGGRFMMLWSQILNQREPMVDHTFTFSVVKFIGILILLQHYIKTNYFFYLSEGRNPALLNVPVYWVRVSLVTYPKVKDQSKVTTESLMYLDHSNFKFLLLSL